MTPDRFPFKTLLAVGLLSFVLVDNPPFRLSFAHTKDMVKKAEFYPLSSFSMYSTFSDMPFYVYLTDNAGKPIPVEAALKTHASELKKTYEAKLKAQKKKADMGGRLMEVPLNLKRAAGEETLALLAARPETVEYLASLTDVHLQLHEVILTAGDDEINKAATLVAEWTGGQP